MIAFERVVDAFRANGLIVQDRGHGKADAQAPGHSPADRSVSIKDIGDQVLIHSHSDPTDDVLTALSLTLADLFDSPKGSTYQYPDGRVVRRTPDKKFSQGNADGKTSLYRADRLTEASTVWMPEGEKDVHALESEGVTATCTAMGAGKAHMFDLTPLHGKTVVIVRDKDERGEAHTQQLIGLLASESNVQVMEAKVGKDAADHIAAGHTIDEFVDITDRYAQLLLATRIKAAVDSPTASLDEMVATLYRHLDKTAATTETEHVKKFDVLVDEWWDWIDTPPSQRRTIPTPWPEVDDALAGGLHPGRSYLIAGRPGGGKSLGLTNIAAHAAGQGHKGILFSVEMGRMEITSRIMAAGASAEYGQITRRTMDDYNRSRVAAYASDAQAMPLWVSDQAALTIEQIHTEARKLKTTQGLDFVAVDYAQLLKPTDSRATRERQIATISWGLKTLSNQLDIAVITACQLNRGATKEDRPPTIAELRESGSLEQDADVVILLHHEKRDGEPSGEIQLIIGKNRTGPLTTIAQPWRAHYAKIG